MRQVNKSRGVKGAGRTLFVKGAGRTLFVWALILLYGIIPVSILLLFRGPEVLGVFQHGRGGTWAAGASISTFLLTAKYGWQGFIPCLSIILGALKYSMDVSLWVPPPETSLAGKVAVVTGSNSGIGLHAAKALAGMGAHVVLTCRSEMKCKRAIQKVQAAANTGGGLASFVLFNLSSLESAYNLTLELTALHPKIHYLFNNAGSTPQHSLTEEGLEDGFGGMHLAHMALTLGLLPSLRRAGTTESPSRIIMTSSDVGISAACGHFEPFQSSFLEGNGEGDLRGEVTRGDGTTWNSLAAYGRAKLCNTLFAFEINRHLARKQWPVIAHALHTGAVMTHSASSGMASMFRGVPGLPDLVSKVLVPLLWRTPEQGARTLLFAALATEPPSMSLGGLYLDSLCYPLLFDGLTPESDDFMKTVRIGNKTLHLYTDRRKALQDADEKWSTRLWEVSIRLLRLSPARKLIGISQL